jgi:hypothetical protein
MWTDLPQDLEPFSIGEAPNGDGAGPFIPDEVNATVPVPS